MDGFDLVSKERVDTLRAQPAAAAGSRAAAERQARGLSTGTSQTPVGGRRATRVDEPAAWGVREHARAPPSLSTSRPIGQLMNASSLYSMRIMGEQRG
eukprot:scaffold9341_cov24-Phaeocystis_antarctica.AAC.1